jgi:hypothetical protein
MEQFCVFANSEDSLNIFNDNAGGRIRVYFPNSYILDGTWECALLEVTFVSKLTTPTRRIYVCCNFVDNSYVKDSYIPVLQSLSVLNEDVTDATFENPFKQLSIWRLVIPLSTFLLLGGRPPPSMSSSPQESGSSSFYFLWKWTRQNT